MLDFNTLFLYFIIYSVIGWIAEMLYCRIFDGRFSDRGFLYGPYCPIYGFGGLIVLILLEPFNSDPMMLFLLAVIFTTILEYITSFAMEKIFNAKWWDYSNMPINLNGRICLLNSILFGIFGVLATYFVHPYVQKLISIIPESYVPRIINILLIILSIDFAFSLNSIINLRNKLKEIREIANSVRDRQKSKIEDSVYIKQLTSLKSKLALRNSFESNRLLKAFPSLKFNNLNDELSELKESLNKRKEEKLKAKEAKKQEKESKKL